MRQVGAGGGSEGRDRAARRSAETIKCRRLQDVGLVGAAAAGMMMPEMIKAAVMKTTMAMLAAIEGGDGELRVGKSAEVKSA